MTVGLVKPLGKFANPRFQFDDIVAEHAALRDPKRVHWSVIAHHISLTPHRGRLWRLFRLAATPEFVPPSQLYVSP